MLCVEILVDVLVQLLVGPCGLCCVEIAAACDIAIGSIEVESTGDGLKVLDR